MDCLEGGHVLLCEHTPLLGSEVGQGGFDTEEFSGWVGALEAGACLPKIYLADLVVAVTPRPHAFLIHPATFSNASRPREFGDDTGLHELPDVLRSGGVEEIDGEDETGIRFLRGTSADNGGVVVHLVRPHGRPYGLGCESIGEGALGDHVALGIDVAEDGHKRLEATETLVLDAGNGGGGGLGDAFAYPVMLHQGLLPGLCLRAMLGRLR